MPDVNQKLPILLADLKGFKQIQKAIIESIEQALFRLEIEVDGSTYHVMESKSKILTRRSILELQALLTPYKIKSMYLLHSSPYDEMIGHEVNQHSNEMLVPLGDYFAEDSSSVRH